MMGDGKLVVELDFYWYGVPLCCACYFAMGRVPNWAFKLACKIKAAE